MWHWGGGTVHGMRGVNDVLHGFRKVLYVGCRLRDYSTWAKGSGVTIRGTEGFKRKKKITIFAWG